VLTATSPTSRNFSFGLAVGKGASRAQLGATGQPLAEGVETAPALLARAKAEGVELPIAGTTAAILDGTLALDAAIPRLMSRPLKIE
jgi:glycerol-3-phosphate dehydrogenase (NAD(P)+)